MRVKKIDIPLYFGKLVLIQDKNWDKVNKKYETNASKFFEAFVFKVEKHSGRTEYIGCFLNGKVDIGIIAHEAVHLVNHIFKDRFVDLDLDNDEPQAYLTGWIVTEIDKFVNGKKK